MSLKRKSLFHACCAPCASVGTAAFAEEGREFSLYFYGGNIHPLLEWTLRRDSLMRLASAYGVELIARPYDTGEWDACTDGMGSLPEGGERCVRCMRLQLEQAAETAVQRGLSVLCTSLTLSPQKNPDLINQWGKEIAERFGLEWEKRIWRKKGGSLFAVTESKRLGLYRQNYCGCRFSLKGPAPQGASAVGSERMCGDERI